LTPSCAGFVERIGVGTWTAKIYSVFKTSYASCLGLSPAISAQFTLEMCVIARNREKSTKIPYFGGSRSFNVIDVDTSKKLVAGACLCLFVKSVFTLDEPIAAKCGLFTPLSCFSSRGHKIFFTKKTSSCGSPL